MCSALGLLLLALPCWAQQGGGVCTCRAQILPLSSCHLAATALHTNAWFVFCEDCGASTYIRHRHQIKCAFHEWLRELDQRKAELTGSQPTAGWAPQLAELCLLVKLIVHFANHICKLGRQVFFQLQIAHHHCHDVMSTLTSCWWKLMTSLHTSRWS